MNTSKTPYGILRGLVLLVVVDPMSAIGPTTLRLNHQLLGRYWPRGLLHKCVGWVAVVAGKNIVNVWTWYRCTESDAEEDATFVEVRVPPAIQHTVLVLEAECLLGGVDFEDNEGSGLQTTELDEANCDCHFVVADVAMPDALDVVDNAPLCLRFCRTLLCTRGSEPPLLHPKGWLCLTILWHGCLRSPGGWGTVNDKLSTSFDAVANSWAATSNLVWRQCTIFGGGAEAACLEDIVF